MTIGWRLVRLVPFALLLASLAGALTVRSGNAADPQPVAPINLVTWTKAQYPVQYEEASVLAEAWKKLGLDVKIEALNFPNPLLERVFKTREFDGAILYFTGQLERLDPEFYTYNAFHSSRAVEGGWNFSGIMNKDLDRLLEAQRAEYDPGKRKVIVDQIQEWIFRESPWLVMVNQDEVQAYNKTNFSDPVVPKVTGFNDPQAFFTLKPRGARKVIRWASPISDLKTINPILASESSQIRVLYLAYDTLVKYGPDTKPGPWAASEIKAVGPTVVEVTLRNDLKFHDGVKLTANDVKFTFDLLIKHNAPYFKTVLEPLESVEVMSPTKVRFKLKRAYAPFTTQTLAMTPLLPKHVWEKIDKPTEYENIPAVGSGPFKFDHWKKGQEVKFSRFADHFRPAAADGVLLVFFGTREGAYTALVKQEADVLDRMLSHQVDELSKMEHVQVVRVPSNAADTVVLNARRKPFDDPQFRTALSYAIPRKQILGESYNGLGNLGASVIAPANEAWSNNKIKPHDHDVEKAKDILKKAGYGWDGSGRLTMPAR
jgi:peptide/nickel transport system substrate-binding protein